MRRFWRGVVVGLALLSVVGCATSQPPPSDSTMTMLRSYRANLENGVATGQLTKRQARDLLYGKLGEVRPPLPNLGQLLEFRKQVESQEQAKALSSDQAETILEARESEMLFRWEEMASRAAVEQREIDELRKEYERGRWNEKQLEQGEKVFRDRPRF